MNKNQRIVLILVMVAIVGMFLYPPFHIVIRGNEVNVGYDWIFSLPNRLITPSVNIKMLLAQWLGVLIIGGIAFFIAKDAPSKPNMKKYQDRQIKNNNSINSHHEKQINGIGGWLLFLILLLTLFFPLKMAYELNLVIMISEYKNSNIVSLHIWKVYKIIIWSVYFVFCGISFYGGLILLKKRERIAVKRAQLILWIIGPVAFVIFNIFIPVLILGKIPGDQIKLIIYFIKSIIISSIWTLYLVKSKRVLNTYNKT